MTKRTTTFQRSLLKNYIFNTKTKFSAACHNLLEGCGMQPKKVVACSRKT